MSILNKINDANVAAKARSAKINEGIAHAAKVLHESVLGTRCPNLVKGTLQLKFKKWTASTF